MQQKQATHSRLFAAAERCFRAQGYAGTGVDAVARSAGATSGALYAHFDGKAALFREVLRQGLERFVRRTVRLQEREPETWLNTLAAWYVGAEHRADLAGGCVLPSLASDVARSGDAEAMAAWAEGMARIHAVLVGAHPFQGRGDADELGWRVLSLLVGATALARAAGSDQADSIAGAAQSAVAALLAAPPGANLARPVSARPARARPAAASGQACAPAAGSRPRSRSA